MFCSIVVILVFSLEEEGHVFLVSRLPISPDSALLKV